MNLVDAVAARRSVRDFAPRPVPRDAVDRAITLAAQAPAPHHSAPWRFVLVEAPADKERLSRVMGAAWEDDLRGDGVPPHEVEAIVGRSHRLLARSPLLVVCCADMTRSHSYADDRRRRAEWSLFAHSTGAALQTFMTSLAADGIGSCWISAPVFCGEVVKAHLGLAPQIEPQALVLVGYPAPGHRPRARPRPDPGDYVIRAGSPRATP